MKKIEWIRCPICNGRTRNKVREDTVLINYPFYCPKCKQENLINVKLLKVVVIKEPDAKTQSR
ncbi:cysteine-rich KTR domain-containing protein [Roseburia hominis]